MSEFSPQDLTLPPPELLPAPDLTSKQALYCLRWAETASIKEAAAQAGMNYDYCRSIHNEPHIVAERDRLQDELMKKAGLNANHVLRRAAEMSDWDPMELMDSQGKYKPITQWPIAARRSIKTIEHHEDGKTIKKVTFEPRGQALKMVGDHVKVKAFQTEGPPPSNKIFVLDMTGLGSIPEPEDPGGHLIDSEAEEIDEDLELPGDL